MSYIDVLKTTQNVMTPGSSACQGCGGELILRRVMQIAGNNSVFAVPPGCMAGAGVDGWNFSNGCTAPIHITLLDNTASFMSGVSEMYQRKGRPDVNIVAIAGRVGERQGALEWSYASSKSPCGSAINAPW